MRKIKSVADLERWREEIIIKTEEMDASRHLGVWRDWLPCLWM